MKYRAGATITNGAGETPLHIAARYPKILTILLTHKHKLQVQRVQANTARESSCCVCCACAGVFQWLYRLLSLDLIKC